MVLGWSRIIESYIHQTLYLLRDCYNYNYFDMHKAAGMSGGDVEQTWSNTAEKLCELLRWARSEGFVDLVTLNSFLETISDLSELFKTIKTDLEQQNQVTSWPLHYLCRLHFASSNCGLANQSEHSMI